MPGRRRRPSGASRLRGRQRPLAGAERRGGGSGDGGGDSGGDNNGDSDGENDADNSGDNADNSGDNADNSGDNEDDRGDNEDDRGDGRGAVAGVTGRSPWRRRCRPAVPQQRALSARAEPLLPQGTALTRPGRNFPKSPI